MSDQQIAQSLEQEILKQNQDDARKQRELFQRIQSNQNNDIAELRLQEGQMRMKRDARGRFLGNSNHPDDVGDSTLNVFFTKEKRLNKALSMEAGKAVHTDIDFITIIPPGMETQLTVHSPVTPYYEWRFGKEYQDWKNGVASQGHGLSLREWEETKNDTIVIREMERHGISTVEQLASANDQTSAFIAHFATWKSLAQKFVKSHANTENDSKMEAALEKVRSDHAAEMAKMNEQMVNLLKVLEEQRTPKIVLDEKPSTAAKKSTYKKKTQAAIIVDTK
jgi:hypothetical protein